jgi:hypothetical protein
MSTLADESTNNNTQRDVPLEKHLKKHDSRATVRRLNQIEAAFAYYLIEMLEHPSFRILSLAARRVLCRIQIELAHHGGHDNGKLPITCDQFVDYGVHRHSVGPAVRELEALGFITVRFGRAGNAEFRTPSLYGLTWRPTAMPIGRVGRPEVERSGCRPDSDGKSAADGSIPPRRQSRQRIRPDDVELLQAETTTATTTQLAETTTEAAVDLPIRSRSFRIIDTELTDNGQTRYQLSDGNWYFGEELPDDDVELIWDVKPKPKPCKKSLLTQWGLDLTDNEVWEAFRAELEAAGADLR